MTRINQDPAVQDKNKENPMTNDECITICCHLERLGPKYDDNYIHFSLNLSVILNSTSKNTELLQYLKPWEWKWKELAVLGIKDKKTVKIDKEYIEILSESIPEDPPEQLKTFLEGEFAAASASIEPFLGFPEKLLETKTIDENKRDWKGFLAHVSTFPAPLPQVLKLSVFFRIASSNTVNVAEIVAAPVFKDDPLFSSRSPIIPTEEDEKDVTKEANPVYLNKNNQPPFYLWKYSGNGVTLNACLNPCSTEDNKEDNKELLNLKHLWVQKSESVLASGGQIISVGEDWTIQFESRLAGAFDMPRRLIDALHINIRSLQETHNLKWTIDNNFHTAFLASLRDLANFGCISPPDSMPFAKHLIKKFLFEKEAFIKTYFEHLQSEEEGKYKNISKWKIRLREIIENFPKDLPDISDIQNLNNYARILERAYSTLTDEKKLRDYFFSEWDAVFSQIDDFKIIWNSKKNNIMNYLADIQLRKRLALGNCGVAWRNLEGENLAEKGTLEKAIISIFNNYLENRLGTNKGDYSIYYPHVRIQLPDALVADLRENIKKSFVNSFYTPAAFAENNGSISDINEDLVIQVNSVRMNPGDGTTYDQDDRLRRIAGVGVLLRKQGQGPEDWKFLNLAYLKPGGATKNKSYYSDPVPVPLRLGYRNGLRQSYVSYRNHPMAAGSPAAKLSAKRHMHMDAPLGEAILSYGNPYPYKDDQGKQHILEALVYGEKYEAAVFLIGNAGNLPKELVRGINGKKLPWKWQKPSNDPTDENDEALRNVIQTIKYLRRVPVGKIRVGSTLGRQSNNETEKLNIPPIPENVWPLTRSLLKGEDSDGTLLLLTPSKDTPWNPDGVDRTHFEFTIRPPSVPIQVWDRWVAKESGNKDKRIAVWAKFHELSDILDSETKASKSDISIDDPAVTGFHFKLSPEYQLNKAQEEYNEEFLFTENEKDCSNDLKCVQRDALIMKITGGSFSFKKTFDEATGKFFIEISIPEGEVWKLEIFPVVDNKVTERFDGRIREKYEPMAFFIEVASKLSNSDEMREKMNAALSCSLHENDQNLFQVFVAPAQLALSDDNKKWQLRDMIHRVEVLLQRWRWDGRPLCYFNDNATTPIYGFPISQEAFKYKDKFQEELGKLEKFDGTLFASRESSDNLVIPKQVDFSFVKDIYGLVVTTKDYRKKDFPDLDEQQKNNIKRLNRLLLEETYPQQTPKENKLDFSVNEFRAPFTIEGLCKVIKDDKYDIPLQSIDSIDGLNELLKIPKFYDILHEKKINKLLYQTDISSIPGALYYRVGIRAYSRYEGLLRGDTYIDSRMSESRAERWKRCVVPCRWNKPVPPPVIKLIIPLTQALPDTTNVKPSFLCPGLLVVLDESWYIDSMGGFGETFDWEIAKTALPKNPAENKHQFGPDPILNMSADPLLNKEISCQDAIGAIGYTMDTDTLAPLFTRASFILPPPAVKGKAVKGKEDSAADITDLSWYFLKIRFRRVLNNAPDLARPESPWTEPQWVQILPPSNFFHIDGGSAKETKDLFLSIDKKAFCTKNPEKPVKLKPIEPQNESESYFCLYVLLTRKIVDALGRRDQEAFVDLVHYDMLSEVKEVKDKIQEGIRARLVEIQFRVKNVGDNGERIKNLKLQDLSQMLFPTKPMELKADNPLNSDNDCDNAEARIVRVSPPIDAR
ncbi:MAG: hypothetical protein HW390_607 [Candidatus Brocadiaceae bacterium]|nr:hypothetical protein [Candidatus Brocadiaceae bacterium]